MTLAEFKAWFEGFTEDMDARPTDKQWKRIKARVKEIDGTAITREIWHRNYYPYWQYVSGLGSTQTITTYGCAQNTTSNLTLMNASTPSYSAALNAIGKAEYAESLAA